MDEPAEPPKPEIEPPEDPAERKHRYAQRRRLYITAFALAVVIVLVVALTIANTRRVKLSWVVGDTRTSLVWIILTATLLGWLLGIATSVAFRLRTRRRK